MTDACFVLYLLLVKPEMHGYAVSVIYLRLALYKRQEVIQCVYRNVVSLGVIHSFGKYLALFAHSLTSSGAIPTR